MKSAEELYILKVRGFLFGLKTKSKQIGDIDIEKFISKIAITNPNMAIELSDEYDNYKPKENIVEWF
jgi:hypothetical protein